MLTALFTLLSTAHAGPHAIPAQAACPTAELRVSAPTDDWYDLYVDGVLEVESRNFDGQKTVRGLAPGRHHVRVMDFVGNEVFSQETLAFGCGDVVVAEVYERGGLRVVSSWSTAPPPPPVHRSQRPRHARPVSYRPGRSGHRGPPARPAPRAYTCEPGELAVVPSNNAWFDLYVDGVRRVQSRNENGRQTVIAGLAPGRHHVRVQSFTGQPWSETVIEVGCNERVSAEVLDRRGLRVF